MRTTITTVTYSIICLFSIGFVSADKIPPKLPINLFAQLPSTTSVKISPDGRHIAWITGLAEGRKHILITSLINKPEKPMVIPPTENADINWFKWANNQRLLVGYKFDGKRIAYRSRTMETRLYSVSIDGSSMINMTKPKTKTSKENMTRREVAVPQNQDNIIDLLPNDPDHILTSVNEYQNARMGYLVRKVNVNNGHHKPIMRRNWMTHWVTDHSHTLRLTWGYKRSSRSERKIIFYRNPETDEWDNITNSVFHKKFDFVDFYDDPRYAYVSGEIDDRRGLLKFDMLKQKVVSNVFSHQKYDINHMLWHPISDKLIGVSYIADRDVNIYFDKTMTTRQKLLDKYLKGFENSVVSSSADGSKHIIFSSNETDPGVFYLYDETTKRLDEVAQHYRGIHPAHMATVEEISYKARDGLTIHAYLTLPKGLDRKNLPTVILPHGGPWARDYKSFDYIAQLLANRGYAVLQPNFRGSTGYGYSFQKAGENQWGLAMQDDVTDGAKWMIKQEITDPARMCIVGWSYGGYAALMGAVKTPDLYNCSASINGVTDLLKMMRKDKTFVGSSSWIATIGDPGDDKDILKQTSPARQYNKIKTPVLIVHAEDDMRVNVKQAKLLADKLQKKGKNAKLVIIERGGHSLDIEESRTQMLQALDNFLAKHLAHSKY